MKLLLSLVALAMAAGGTYAQANDNVTAMDVTAAKSAEARRFAKDLPQTLVLRKDTAGNWSYYHSPQYLPKGKQLNVHPQMANMFSSEASEATDPSATMRRYRYGGLGGLGGLFNFFWNVANPFSYSPYYSYYNPGYNYSYNYGYSPYYNYYDPYGYQYYYYSW